MLQATIANANRGKNQKAYEPDQFMPKWGMAKAKDSGPMSGDDMLAAVKAYNRRMGGK